MKTRIAIFLLALSLALPASAFDSRELGQYGSLPLSDLMTLIRNTPKLNNEITEALLKLEKKPDEIICGGKRFARTWDHLGGRRVAPYDCGFGNQTLEIEANVRLTAKDGREFKTITPESLKDAEFVSETDMTWNWK
jgi:hypothetical protein